MAIKKTITKDKKKYKVTFSLPQAAAPNANSVRVVGDFNDWDWDAGLELKKNKTEFKGQMELSAGQRQEFRYLIDNERWENDWQADDYARTPYGCDNSVVICPSATATQSSPGKAPNSNKSNSSSTTKKTKSSKGKIDFTVIEGIGPKICRLLETGGYPDFEALSKAKVGDLRNILKNAGSRYSMHDPSQWAKQAKFAVNNQWTKLNAFQAELKNKK